MTSGPAGRTDGGPADIASFVADLYRAEWGRLLSLLIARTRRLDLAEDALSEAFTKAAQRWPGEGLPENPPAWLYTTAYRVIIGALRSEAVRGRRTALLATGASWEPVEVIDDLDRLHDERLTLILLCCHPALRPEARSALALRMVIGTSTSEIARLFLVPTSTMAARITRAKKKIVAAGIPLARPADTELRLRLGDVCRTIYLAFTAGYTPGDGDDLLRPDLAGEAVELSGVVAALAPESDQVRALRGLLLLQHGRRHARVSEGELVTLGDQDRSLWVRSELDEGLRLVGTVAPHRAGPSREGARSRAHGSDLERIDLQGIDAQSVETEALRLQGCIAAEHAIAKTTADTNWTRIAELYLGLERWTGSPVVRLNRAVAVAEAEGAEAGLALLDGLEPSLGRGHRFHAVAAELLTRAGDKDAAARSLTAAIARCNNATERRFLSDQLAAL